MINKQIDKFHKELANVPQKNPEFYEDLATRFTYFEEQLSLNVFADYQDCYFKNKEEEEVKKKKKTSLA